MDNLSNLDINKSYSYADYLTWKFQERLELIKGRIFKMSPAPGVNHQRLSGNLYAKLHNYLFNKECEVFSAPFDVRLSRKRTENEQITTVAQPAYLRNM